MICRGCVAGGHKSCQVCDRPIAISYCSEKCNSRDIKEHTITCHREYGERLVSIVEYIIQYCGERKTCFSENHIWNISYGFGIDDILLKASSNSEIDGTCVICQDNATAITHSLTYASKRKVGRTDTLNYYLCTRCSSQGLSVCPVYLRDTSKCTQMHQWWTLLGCLRRIDPNVPKDIKQILFQFVKPCNH